jgi:hypothetical protein
MAHLFRPAPAHPYDRVPVWTDSDGTVPAVITTPDGTPIVDDHKQPVLVADAQGKLPEFACADSPVFVGAPGDTTQLDPLPLGEDEPAAAVVVDTVAITITHADSNFADIVENPGIPLCSLAAGDVFLGLTSRLVTPFDGAAFTGAGGIVPLEVGGTNHNDDYKTVDLDGGNITAQLVSAPTTCLVATDVTVSMNTPGADLSDVTQGEITVQAHILRGI